MEPLATVKGINANQNHNVRYCFSASRMAVIKQENKQTRKQVLVRTGEIRALYIAGRNAK